MLDALNDTLNIIIDYITYKDLTNLNNISKKKNCLVIRELENENKLSNYLLGIIDEIDESIQYTRQICSQNMSGLFIIEKKLSLFLKFKKYLCKKILIVKKYNDLVNKFANSSIFMVNPSYSRVENEFMIGKLLMDSELLYDYNKDLLLCWSNSNLAQRF
jgi:hypothetical protein